MLLVKLGVGIPVLLHVAIAAGWSGEDGTFALLELRRECFRGIWVRTCVNSAWNRSAEICGELICHVTDEEKLTPIWILRVIMGYGLLSCWSICRGGGLRVEAVGIELDALRLVTVVLDELMWLLNALVGTICFYI
jgi:hypothetical protein